MKKERSKDLSSFQILFSFRFFKFKELISSKPFFLNIIADVINKAWPTVLTISLIQSDKSGLVDK